MPARNLERMRYVRQQRREQARFNQAPQDPHQPAVTIDTHACECHDCGAILMENESPSMCCGNGKYVLPDEFFPHIPDELMPILHSTEGRKLLRRLNSLFCMASVGVSGELHNVNTHPAVLKLMGGLYHCILPRNRSRNPTTWVIYDSAERVAVGQEWDIPVEYITTLRNLLYRVNPFSRYLKALGDTTQMHDASLVLKFPPRQSTDEVAAVYDYTGATSAQERDITFFFRDSDVMHFITSLHPAYMPLAYPLLYPFGNHGYDPSRKTLYSQRPMTMLRFYRQIYIRSPILHLAGRLAQQHLLDVWTSIDDETLDYIRNTVNARLAQRMELDETINAEGGPRAGRVYLPASFNRGVRHRMQLIDDGMAVVARFGQPTYFITVTCNPDWPEIQQTLLGNTKASDNPMVVCRVFHSKLQKIMKFIKTKFGPVVYYMYVIEFQKRGLPHAHIALRTENPPREAHEIDQMITATLPSDPTSRLYELVTKNMTHTCINGLCLDAPVAEGSVCKKHFPKEITHQTHLDDKGFPVYKRLTERDQYIVPYNPHLLCFVDSHVNVELASYVNVIRYLYKYLYKENDMTPAAITDADVDVDEITQYRKSRYCSASEAAWRLKGFHMQGRFPAVQMVPIHLPGRDTVLFYENMEQAALDNTVSKLNRYFGRPAEARFDSLTYTQYYEQYKVQATRPPTHTHYWVDNPDHGPSFFVWEKKDRSTVVRIQHVLPTQGDVWYLRVLLTRIPARAASDYLTVVDPTYIQCDTFQEAALARGLVTGETEGLLTFEETLGSGRNHPRGLRSLFVTMTYHGFHMKPVLLQYYNEMSYDIRGATPATTNNNLLADLNNRLNSLGKTLEDYGMPMPQDITTEIEKDAMHFQPHKQRDIYENLYNLCTQQQKTVADYVIEKVDLGRPLTLFLQAPAGHGKSHVFKTVAAACRSNGHIVVTMATTGLASLNFERGRTLHSTFRMSVVDDPREEPVTCDISNRSQRANYLRAAKLFLLDEAIMGHRAWFDAMDQCLRDVCQTQEPFGGKVVVFAGDFRQLPTVVKGGSDADVYHASIAGFRHWGLFEVFQLTVPLRDTQDPEWSQMVKATGDDALQRDHEGLVHLPYLNGTTDTTTALLSIYPDELLLQPHEAAKRAILTGTNVVVDELNNFIMSRLMGEERTYYSHDENASLEESTTYNPLNNLEVLNSVNPHTIPPHELTLRIGSVCFIERNLSAEDGLMHNCKVEILGFLHRTIEVKVLTGPATGTIVLIPRIIFEHTMPRTGVKLRRRQFPLRLAYTMTYNKSQGQTLDQVVLDLRNPPFAHGQLYVGISRVRGRAFALALLSEVEYLQPVVRCLNIVNKFFMTILRRIEAQPN